MSASIGPLKCVRRGGRGATAWGQNGGELYSLFQYEACSVAALALTLPYNIKAVQKYIMRAGALLQFLLPINEEGSASEEG